MERIKFESSKERIIAKSPLRWRLGFARIPNEVIQDTRLDKTALLIFIVLRMHQFANKDHSFPSWKTLCKESRLGRGSINKGIKLLEELGYAKVDRKNGKVNKYYLR